MPNYALLGLAGIGAGLVTIVASRILFGWKHRISLQSFRREFVGFVLAYLIFHPLSLLFAIALLGIFPAGTDEVTELFLVLAIMVSAGIPAGWFWTKIMR